MELIYGNYPEDRKRKIIHKYGFTQGSPLSPLMCNYALELAGINEIEGLIMYADDGIIVTEKEIKLNEILSKYLVKLSGVRLAMDKP
jgi:retron-type reverse transcriptase